VIVCGGIADAFRGNRYPGIRFHGIVEDLERYYELSDIVLLPVIMGAGVVIKTIEAVLYERPVVATRYALRGLPSEIVDAVGYVADSDEFAGAIVRMLQSSAAREQQVRRVRIAAKLLHNEQFYRRLARSMAKVRIAAAEVPTGRGSVG
jgi:glycosyltransferase involved in cell wall biosynthesis